MKLAYLALCIGLVACGKPFTAETGSGGGGSGTVTVSVPDAGTDSGSDAGCIPKECNADSCGSTDDGCGNPLDCGTCPDQVDGYPSACLDNVCHPFNDTIFSSQCVAVCGSQNVGAWNNCLTECQDQNCTVEQSCTNCNFLFSAEPDCLPCLHTNFPGQSCGG